MAKIQKKWNEWARTAARIVNKLRGINRAVYGITSKPLGTIE